jgi:hypothetical protein
MFKKNDEVKFDGYRTGTVLDVREDVVGFNTAVQVLTHPYNNKMWFEAEYLTAITE